MCVCTCLCCVCACVVHVSYYCDVTGTRALTFLFEAGDKYDIWYLYCVWNRGVLLVFVGKLEYGKVTEFFTRTRLWQIFRYKFNNISSLICHTHFHTHTEYSLSLTHIWRQRVERKRFSHPGFDNYLFPLSHDSQGGDIQTKHWAVIEGQAEHLSLQLYHHQVPGGSWLATDLKSELLLLYGAGCISDQFILLLLCLPFEVCR